MSDVQQTLFFPLVGWADATHRWPDLFPDPWAEHTMGIRETEGSTAQQPGTFPATVYGLHHLLTIREINTYLKGHPDAAVVNVGCGFDQIVHEIAGADSLAYNIDFPEVIETRERWAEPHTREVTLPYPAIDHRWMDYIDACKGLVAMAAGVFYYFRVDEIKALIWEMGVRFPGSRLCYNIEPPWVTAGSEKSIRRNGTPDVRMSFRVKDPFSAWTWNDRIDDVHVKFDFSSYLPAPKRAKLPRGIRFAFRFFRVFRGMCEVVITFK